MTTEQGKVLLRSTGLRVGYGGRAILPPIDIELRPGQLWAVVGRNGTGKTTWFRTLLGLTPAVAGSIACAPSIALSYVPQRSQLDPLFPVLARDVVAMGRLGGWSFLRPSLSTPPEVMDAMGRTGTTELASQPFRELSEGQKQRVLLARTLSARPQLALLDEPTSAMDHVAERDALEQLDWLRREHGACILVVSHFLGLIRGFADHTILFDVAGEQVVAGPTAEVLAHAVFERNYAGQGADACEVGEP